MVLNIRSTAVPLLTRGVALFLLLLLSCMVPSSLADSLPSFIKSLEDQTGVSGGVASFVCQATGEPKPRLTWMKSGKKVGVSLQRAEVVEFDDGSSSVLRIQPLRKVRDEATYECTASNSVGEISSSAKLTVYDEDQIPYGFPTIDMGPQLSLVERGRTATMLCAASGNPDPEISWYKDMLPMDLSNSTGRFKQLRSGTKTVLTPVRGALQIENSEESDQGKYECVATSSAGTRYSAPANLYVRLRRVPPRFSIPPTNQEVMPGGSVNLTCVAVGSPMPYVKWMLGSEDLTIEDEMPLSRNVLELTNIRESANYTCVAMSSLGVIETTAEVTVKVPAQPSSIETETEQDNGNVLTSMSLAPPRDLKVEVLNSTAMRVTWRPPLQEKQDRQIQGYQVIFSRLENGQRRGQSSIIDVTLPETLEAIIGGLHPETTYSVTVAAYMAEGDGARCKAKVITTNRPGSGKVDIRISIIMDTALIQWRPPQEMVGDLIGYRLLYKRTDDDSFISLEFSRNIDRYSVTGLHKGATFVFQLSPRTHAGFGEASIIEISTPEDVPSGFPINLQVTEKTQSSIHVTWEPPLLAEQNGKIIDYLVMYGDIDSRQTGTIKTRETHVTIQGLSPDTTYYIRVQAINSKGAGPVSPSIQSRTMSEDLQSP